MTFYQLQVQKLHERLYAKDYLVKQVIQAKRYIDTGFSEKINLAEIAAKACISKFHFIRLFKTFYGVTPHQYIITIRIRNAKKLLSANAAIGDVIAATGFESATYFNDLFKKMTGFTPGLYRRKSNLQEYHNR